MELSIVILYHQEGEKFITESINQIQSTIDIKNYEIIVVDDGSNPPLARTFKLLDSRIRHIRHLTNKGVGAAFDSGVAVAQTDNIFLAASDIRYVKNGWASKIVKEIEEHPKAFTCTSCVCLNAENMDIEKRRLVSVVNGATIILFHDQKSNPHMTPSFRGIIEAKWLPHVKNRNIDSFEIPCILGAAYGVSKKWYEYVDGWAGHYLWGTLEPYISLKSWFFGGSCRTAPQIETGHIFKKVGTHGTPQDALMYNKMFVAMVLFDDSARLIRFLGNNSIIQRAQKRFNDNLEFIMAKKKEYQKKIVINPDDYFKRWNIDLRKEI